MRVALCNEVLMPMEFAKQCDYAAALGYDGLELAPYTVSEEPHRLTPAARADLRSAAKNAGISIMGLHYLLVAPKGLSITTPDDATRAHTVAVMRDLIELCAELGGRYMVHGSQRVVAPGETRETAMNRARDSFAAIADRAQACAITYCIEPLAADITPVINTLSEAAAIADSIGSQYVVAMIDCNHASKMENEPLPALIDRWLPTGKIGHVQLSDPNRCGPGQGALRFAPVLAALQRNAYAGDLSIEPMQYIPDGAGSAARAIGYVRGLLEALEAKAV